MNKKRLFWHFSLYLIITLLALFASSLFSSQAIRSFYEERTSLDLKARALLVDDQLLPLFVGNKWQDLTLLCKKLGAKSTTRFTVVDANGLVAADSDENPARLDNHGDRPEILAALSGTTGTSIRFSYTLQKNLMYVERNKNCLCLTTDDDFETGVPSSSKSSSKSSSSHTFSSKSSASKKTSPSTSSPAQSSSSSSTSRPSSASNPTELSAEAARDRIRGLVVCNLIYICVFLVVFLSTFSVFDSHVQIFELPTVVSPFLNSFHTNICCRCFTLLQLCVMCAKYLPCTFYSTENVSSFSFCFVRDVVCYEQCIKNLLLSLFFSVHKVVSIFHPQIHLLLPDYAQEVAVVQRELGLSVGQ
jgi:hypothetical protein